MKAILLPNRIRVKPVPTEDGYVLWVWLKKPLNKGSKPVTYADVIKGRKFYDLPCPFENIVGVMVRPK